MLKWIYKTIILVVVFIASLYLFSGDIKVENRQAKLETVSMGKATYPTISILLNDVEVNRLHGYSASIDNQMSRESITPIDEEQSFKVSIKENDYEIKRVDYELSSIYDDRVIESDNIKALEQDQTGEVKLAKIKFKSQLEEEQEYNFRLTLVTSKSKKINYYTRIKGVSNSNYEAKLDYIKDFHNATFNKDESIVSYLESKPSTLDSLSYVTINSSFDLVTWGDLQPKVVANIIPTIKEISSDFASVQLKYIVSTDTESGPNYYYVNEFYRIRYSTSRMFLLNYERSMESVFDSNLDKEISGDIKLGITNNEEIDFVSNSDSTKFAFVFNRELWSFNQFDNSGVKVFSFRQSDSDYIRDTYDEHDVKIVNMDQDGNIDFIVYGYMNRGAYEGHVGLILYRYYSNENRIEELTYIPISTSYQFIKEMIGEFSYINEFDIFYFYINDTIYSYNLMTKQLKEIVSDISRDNFVFSKKDKYIAWEDSANDGLYGKIIIYDLETQRETEINSNYNTNINLLGTIGTDFIYGIANTNDVITSLEGKKIIPMFKIIISNSEGNILKEYQKEGYYITGIEVDGNIITVKRGTIGGEGEAKAIIPEKDDNILNNMNLVKSDIRIVNKDKDSDLKEWFITSPSFSQEAYSYKETVNTVVTQDTTLRLDKEIGYTGEYIVYALGEVEGFYKNAGEAIIRADDLVGVVYDLNQYLIWERGFTKAANEIKDIVSNENVISGDSFKACASVLVKHRSKGENISSNISGFELLQEYFGDSYVNLTGATLDQILYFVSEERPVIAKTNYNYYVVIIGYNSNSITIFDPLTGNRQNINKEQIEEQLIEYGSIYISYSERN